MLYYSKIAVFDLDDTLYIGNSHIEWLCAYYNTRIFRSIFFKALGFISSNFQHYIMYKLYNRVSIDEKINFVLPFRISVVNLLRKKQKEGYFVIVVSNAPLQLIVNASMVLKVDYIRAGFGEKAKALKRNYKYDKLFVCTDNKTDLDLLELSDEAIITCKKKNWKYFRRKLNNKNYKFMIDGES